MTNAALAKDLGCEVRQFVSVRQCLLWYIRQKAARMSMSGFDLGGVGSQLLVGQRRLESSLATYHAVTKCVQSEHMECDADFVQNIGNLSERVAHLACWYQMSVEKGEEFLADQLGMTPRELARCCEFIESIIRKRLRSRGLLVDAR